jgi:hypothetical protein
MIVMIPIAMVTMPTAPCRPRLADVSQRAETASGTAITLDSTPLARLKMVELHIGLKFAQPDSEPHLRLKS